MPELRPQDRYCGVFTVHQTTSGGVRLDRHPAAPRTLADPKTGHQLQIATVELSGAICPVCEQRANGGFVSFVADMRVVFACPHCRDLVWLNGA